MAELLRLILKHRGKIVGVLLGLLLGWISIAYGIIKALFVGLLVLAGYYLGSRVDNRESLSDALHKLLPPGDR
ncbi:MAG: DUF2273 domain-containing protein [Firmicutes bacterium]|nr:DUF2273 domain-containing protein [Bacillota bacterium]